jgi:hypothetical protein
MSNRTIPQPVKWNIQEFIQDLFNIDTRKWVNGRPVLLNGDVWCPMCEIWHKNNSMCQQ